MATLTTPMKTFVSGDPLTAADINTYLGGNIDYLVNRPMCKATQTVAQSLTNNVVGRVYMDSEDFDPYNMHSVASNTDRIVVPVAGVYYVNGYIRFASSGPSRVLIRLTKNDVGFHETEVLHSTYNTYAQGFAAAVLKLAANDYVAMMALQNTGAALSTDVGFPPSLTVVYMGAG